MNNDKHNPDEGDPSTANEPDTIAAHLAEPLEQILDLATWAEGDDLSRAYDRLDREIRDSVQQEERVGEEIRRRVLPLIRNRSKAPPGAGLYAATREQLEAVHHNVLFNGATVAADGTVVAHDTLLMTIAQIGVCTVSYIGETGEFRKQLFRRDVRMDGGDPVEEMISLLEERQNRAALGYDDTRDELNQLMRRGLMEYAERGILLRSGPGRWLMGHGSPVPRELLTVGLQTMVSSSLEMLNVLILEHQKFVYIPSAPRELLISTLGNTLAPGQFLIVDTLYESMNRWANGNIYSREMARKVRQFVEEVGPKVVRGVFRASASSPACVFYAHVDHAQEAALIALADSVLQEHRGFPMLLDLADTLCRVSFEPAGFRTIVQQSYARAGQPFRYLTERETRR